MCEGETVKTGEESSRRARAHVRIVALPIAVGIVFFCVVPVIVSCAKENRENPLDPAGTRAGEDPFALRASVSGSCIEVTWNTVGVMGIEEYRVYRKEAGSSQSPSKIATVRGSATRYRDCGVQAGRRYEYQVRAADGRGRESSQSLVVSVEISTNPMLLINSGERYTAVEICTLSILAAGAVSMRTETGPDPSAAEWQAYATTRLDTLSTGTGAKIVSLQVKYGDATVSAVVRDTIFLDQSPPSPPVLVSPSDGTTGVSLPPNLVWQRSVDGEGSPVVYNVYLGEGSPAALVAAGLSNTSHTTSGLRRATAYSWKVLAVDGAGNAATSEVWSFTTQDVPSGFVFLNAFPPATFTMGSPSSEPGRDSDETQHQVTLTRSFYVSQYEVTQSEWESVMGWNESDFRGSSRPVERVTWYDAVSYCNKRSQAEGLTPAYTITGASYSGNHIVSATVSWNQSAAGYRLLTEAEWEYACRAGTQTAFCNGGITNIYCDPVDPNLNQVGWYCGNAGSTTHDVGGKSPNGWGLYDIHGNVWEWCWDWYGSYGGTVTDPTGPGSGSNRVKRGGSWNYVAQNCRSANRYDYTPDDRGNYLGFRLARNVP